MSNVQFVRTQEERIAVATRLLRTRIEALTLPELDLAMALLLEKAFALSTTEVKPPLVLGSTQSSPFSPTTRWEDYGEVVTNVALVTGTHARYDDLEDDERVTGHWYSCHGYYGGVGADGNDLREIVGRTCAALLAHNLQYKEHWRLPSRPETEDPIPF